MTAVISVASARLLRTPTADTIFPTFRASTQYVVAVVSENGWLQSSALGTILREGEELRNQDLGATRSNSITGHVFDDANGNGKQDENESAIYGDVPNDWTIYLDLNNNNALDAGEPSTTTEYFYTFGGLANGTYVVRAIPPWPYELTVPAAGSYTVTFNTLGKAWGKTFAAHRDWDGCGSIAGTVYGDLPGSGVEGFTVFLDADADQVLDPGELFCRTDAQGRYSFDAVPSGLRWVAIQSRAGWIWNNFPRRLSRSSRVRLPP